MLTLVQGNPDMGSDFRLKEMPDRTVLFDSVVNGGTFVGIQGSRGLQTNLNVILVVRLFSLYMSQLDCLNEEQCMIGGGGGFLMN